MKEPNSVSAFASMALAGTGASTFHPLTQCEIGFATGKGAYTAVSDWSVVETIRTSRGGLGRLLASHTAALVLLIA